MAMTSLFLAWLIMTPPQFTALCQSLFYAVLSVSNVHFWSISGYFSDAAELNPLLHTWSLSVEEQFYLIFPFGLALIWRFGRRAVAGVVLSAALVSLTLAEVFVGTKPAASFFLLPTRVFELMAGAGAALLLASGQPRRNGFLSLIGIGAVSLSFVLFDETTHWPSLATLLPVGGTVCVILFTTDADFVGKALTFRPVLLVGLLSYSFYLWHQPLFAFARIAKSAPLSTGEDIGLVVLALLLAWASWKWVETPIRRPAGLATPARRRKTLGGAAGIIAAFAAIAFTAANRVPTLLELENPDIAAIAPPRIALADKTVRGCAGFPILEGELKCTRHGTGLASIVVWGDSHALALRRGITAPEEYSVMVISHPGCPPALSVHLQAADYEDHICNEPGQIEKIARFVRDLEPEIVLLTSRWTLYLNGWHRLGVKLTPPYYLTSANAEEVPSLATSRSALTRGMMETLANLGSGPRVVVMSQTPDLNVFSARSRFSSRVVDATDINEWHRAEDKFLAVLSSVAQVEIISGRSLFCIPKTCELTQRDTRFFTDDNHLSMAGAEWAWGQIVDALQRPTIPCDLRAHYQTECTENPDLKAVTCCGVAH